VKLELIVVKDKAEWNRQQKEERKEEKTEEEVEESEEEGEEGEMDRKQRNEDIMETVKKWITQNRRAKTTQTYQSQYNAYEKFCNEQRIREEDVVSVALHVTKMAEEDKAFSTIMTRVAAINDRRAFKNQPSLLEEPLLKKVLQAAKERTTKPKKQAMALPLEWLKKMAEEVRKEIIATKNSDVNKNTDKKNKKLLEKLKKDVRDLTLFVFMFGGLLRAGEACKLKVEDVTSGQDEETKEKWINLRLLKSKTSKQPEEVILGQANDETIDPLWWYAALQMVFKERRGEEFFFKNFQTENKPLSPQTVSHLLRARLKMVGMEDTKVKQFSSHSFRRGGTTQAVKNNVRRELLQKQGRWKSSAVDRDRYIEVDGKQQTATSKAILNDP
jgi:integrase